MNLAPACRVVRLAKVFDRSPLRSHQATCLSCQAELARQRRLHKALRSLQHEVQVAPPALVASVMAQISARAVSPRRHPLLAHPVAAAAGAAGAVLAGAAGALAVALWRRSHLPA